MIELYLLFLLAAGILFAVIVGYSLLQKRRRQPEQKAVLKEPLLTPSEAQKKAAFAKQEERLNSALSNNAKVVQPSDQAAKPKAVEVEKAVVKIAPVVGRPEKSSADQGDASIDIKSADEEGLQNKANSRSAASAGEDDVGLKLKYDKSTNIVTELVAKFKNPVLIEQQELLALLRLHDYKFHRQINLYGLNQMTERWCDIEFEQPTSRFVELGLSMQLADRNGAMSNKELHDFQQMTLAFSNKFDAPFEFSFDIDECYVQAQKLDEIGRRYDSMAVLNVVPRARAGFRIADIESCAREMMMSPDKKGIFVKSKGHKTNLTVLYRLACTDGTGQFGVSGATGNMVHDLVIYMNVPATEEPDRVFQDMVKDANNLATWLDGKVVDRNGKVMTQRSYTVLMQQITDIVFSMQQDGLSPGDAVSKKLF